MNYYWSHQMWWSVFLIILFFIRDPSEDWNTSCMKLHRDPPSMKALKKRIKFSHSSFHQDLRLRRFYLLECLYVSPNLLYDNGRRYGILECSFTAWFLFWYFTQMMFKINFGIYIGYITNVYAEVVKSLLKMVVDH